MQREQFELHADLEARHWWFVARRMILAALVRQLAPPGAGVRVVDIGCGTGASLAALSADYDVLGLDTSPEAIARARPRFPAVRFECVAEVSGCAAHIQGAAVLLLTDVLEHVADDAGLLAGLVRAATPGAYLLITVPACPALWSPHDVAFGHHRRYERDTLAAVWAGLPVRVRLLSYFNARLYPLVRAVRALTAWRGRSGGRAGTDFRLPPRLLNRLLTRIFSGEQSRLLRLLAGGGRPYARGVSLLAVLERRAETAASVAPVAAPSAAPSIGAT